jgi:hypothetical protein
MTLSRRQVFSLLVFVTFLILALLIAIGTR